MALCISVLELVKVPTPVKSAETLGELELPCVPPNRNERLDLFSTRVAPGGKIEATALNCGREASPSYLVLGMEHHSFPLGAIVGLMGARSHSLS